MFCIDTRAPENFRAERDNGDLVHEIPHFSGKKQKPEVLTVQPKCVPLTGSRVGSGHSTLLKVMSGPSHTPGFRYKLSTQITLQRDGHF